VSVDGLIAFDGDPLGTIHSMQIDGGSSDDIYTSTNPLAEAFALSFSPDGDALLAAERLPGDEFRMIVLDLRENPAVPHPIERERTKEHFGVFSPNGEWIAYVSDEAGEAQVFVRPYMKHDHTVGPQRMISRDGGWYPVWNGDDEILFLDKNAQMLKSVSFIGGDPKPPINRLDLSELELPQSGWILKSRPYDVSHGKLVIVAREKDRRLMEVHVTQNWFPELDRIMRQ
jgi:hypothetical protein